MSVLDIAGDARRIFAELQGGGIAIVPVDFGYALLCGPGENVRKINTSKKRGGHKRNAMVSDLVTQRDVHVIDTRGQEMIEAITQDYDLPLGVIAPFRADHPMIQKLDSETRKGCTAKGTIAAVLNGGQLYEELARLSRENVFPILGSSANNTGTGTKYRVEDVQPEIRACADIVIDYGLRKYHAYGRSSTMLDFSKGVECIRIGTCYDLIGDVLWRHFRVRLPVDPGRDVLPSGHLHEFALTEADSIGELQ